MTMMVLAILLQVAPSDGILSNFPFTKTRSSPRWAPFVDFIKSTTEGNTMKFCGLKATEDSIRNIRDLVHPHIGYKFLNLQIRFPQNYSQDLLGLTDHMHSDTLSMINWVWAENYVGLPLLNYDFRYKLYSLGSLGFNTTDAHLEIYELDEECFKNGTLEWKIYALYFLLNEVLYDPTVSYKLNSSACYARLNNIDESENDYYVQYLCASLQSGTIAADRRSVKIDHVPQWISFDKYDTAGETVVYMVYICLFLFAPLLIKIIPSGRDIYKVGPNGRPIRIDPNLNETSFKHVVEKRYGASAGDVNQDNAKPDDGTADVANEKPVENIEMVARDENVEPGADSHLVEVRDGARKPSNDTALFPAADAVYIPLNNITPVRISHPFRYFSFLGVHSKPSPCMCRFRRVLFMLVLFPIAVHIMLILDQVFFRETVRALVDIEWNMPLHKYVVDVEFFDRLCYAVILPSFRHTFMYICGIMYIICVILSILNSDIVELIQKLQHNEGTLGFIKLPVHLRAPGSADFGIQLVYHQMIHRVSLLVEPLFWRFWILSFKNCFRKDPDDHMAVHVLKVPMRVLGHLVSLVCLVPLLNCIPFVDIMKQFKTDHQTCCSCWRRCNAKLVGKVLLMILLSVVIIFAIMFAFQIFMATCEIFTLTILYTIQGVVKNHQQSFKFISILVMAAIFLLKTLHGVDRKYEDLKSMLFGLCIAKQKGISAEGGKTRLVVYRNDGVPLIPDELFHLVIYKHLPLRIEEMKALVKLLLAGVFFWYVGIVVEVFNIHDRETLGSHLGTLIAASLPSLFSVIHDSKIPGECLKFMVQQTVDEYVTPDSTSRDVVDYVHDYEVSLAEEA